MNKYMKQKIVITFWAESEEVANQAFDFVYDKNIDTSDNQELEFDYYKPDTDGEGGECKVTYTHTTLCDYYPGDYWEPEDYDYGAFIDEYDPKDWFEEFNKEMNNPELIMDVSCNETIEESDDDNEVLFVDLRDC